MDTQNGANASRRDSVSTSQVPATTPAPSSVFDMRPPEDPVEVEQINTVTAAAAATVAASENPRLENRSNSYATFKDCKHVSACRKTSNKKSHHPRQPSSSDIKHPISAFSRTAVVTDRDIDKHLARLLEQSAPDLLSVYIKAVTLPPITHESLAELDITRIINNPKLRHDVNFDKELHFRPNLDGSRGRQKLKVAEDFWKALVAELTLYRLVGAKLVACTTTQDAEYWERMMRSSQRRLPITFETIRDILKTLVPERDQAAVGERIDVVMIMQEISKGVFDMMSLAQWLSTLLKAHCAPMRDEWIDQMAAQVQKGVECESHKDLVVGLRQLLGILEAMKLDVANHQIRHLRAMLIEDGINFQTRYHLTRMQYGRLDMTRAHKWFNRELNLHAAHGSTPDKLRVFLTGLFKYLLSPASMSALPETFSLDSDRLRSMRADLHSLVYVDICMDALDSILARSLPADTRTKAETTLRSSVYSIVGESGRFADAVGNLAVEVVRVAMLAEGTTGLDSVRIDMIEQKLRVALQPTSIAFCSKAQALVQGNIAGLEISVRNNLPLTPLTLHDRMFAPVPAQIIDGNGVVAERAVAPGQVKTIDAILLRICHVSVLHWHIWSPLVYNVPESTTGPLSPSFTSYESETSSSSSSDDESEAGSDVSEASSAGVAPGPSGLGP